MKSYILGYRKFKAQNHTSVTEWQKLFFSFKCF